jgi:hypothetical protein
VDYTPQELVEEGCVDHCFDEPKQMCYGSGDPHYHTFDGCNFDFMGQCRYRLVESTAYDPFFFKGRLLKIFINQFIFSKTLYEVL